MASAQHNTTLAARVALLESRLSLLDADNSMSLFSSISSGGNKNPTATYVSSDQEQTIGDSVNLTGDNFSSLPEQSVFRTLIDVFFERCHNQPYAWFHEEMFRQEYEAGLLPEYLLYAFAATACRFSDHDIYQERRTEAIEAYAHVSFSQIFEHSFSDAEMLELYMVIALSMLAVVEFAGRLMTQALRATVTDIESQPTARRSVG